MFRVLLFLQIRVHTRVVKGTPAVGGEGRQHRPPIAGHVISGTNADCSRIACPWRRGSGPFSRVGTGSLRPSPGNSSKEQAWPGLVCPFWPWPHHVRALMHQGARGGARRDAVAPFCLCAGRGGNCICKCVQSECWLEGAGAVTGTGRERRRGESVERAR